MQSGGELQFRHMLRRTILLRHAEAGWSDGSDRDRPLTPAGAAAAGRVGRFLASLGLEPEAVLSSPAVRARTTAELAVEAAGWRNPVQLEESFYGKGSEAVLTHVRRLPEAVGTVLLVGHEPVWSGLVSGLAGGGRVRFPTAASACLEADLQGWKELDWGRMQLSWLVRPEMLREGGTED